MTPQLRQEGRSGRLRSSSRNANKNTKPSTSWLESQLVEGFDCRFLQSQPSVFGPDHSTRRDRGEQRLFGLIPMGLYLKLLKPPLYGKVWKEHQLCQARQWIFLREQGFSIGTSDCSRAPVQLRCARKIWSPSSFLWKSTSSL